MVNALDVRDIHVAPRRIDPIFRIFIGYDSKEPVAFAVAAHSILARATIPISIVPVTRQSVARIYTRERRATEATEFSLTRFLVPYLSQYEGLSVFMDCDVLVQADLLELHLELLAQPGKAIWVCPHDYVPKSLTKFAGHEQTTYPRKNWSSVMVFDNAKCAALTPDYVNTATGLELHRFHWLRDDDIGCLPLAWNHLVGEYEPQPDAKILHFTNGVPAYPPYAQCDQADLWWQELGRLLKPAQPIECELPIRSEAPPQQVQEDKGMHIHSWVCKEGPDGTRYYFCDICWCKG